LVQTNIDTNIETNIGSFDLDYIGQIRFLHNLIILIRTIIRSLF